jgi:hypothetical protein
MEQELLEIKERNKRVEADKAWETRHTRRFVIMFLTYLTAVAFLKLIGNQSPFVNGLVPVGGYFLSTLSLPTIRRLWLSNYKK